MAVRPFPLRTVRPSLSSMGGSDSPRVFGSPRFCSASLTGCERCPCRVGSGLLPCPGFPFRGSRSVCPATLPSRSRNPTGLPSSCRFSPRIPRSKVDPGRPSGSSPWRFLCIGFWGVNTIAICMTLFNEAVSSFGECGLPCGLRDSLCPLQLSCSALHLCLLHSCNTRYEWLVRPYSAGTCTRQEAPSFAWRTNAKAHREPPRRGLSVSAEPPPGGDAVERNVSRATRAAPLGTFHICFTYSASVPTPCITRAGLGFRGLRVEGQQLLSLLSL